MQNPDDAGPTPDGYRRGAGVPRTASAIARFERSKAENRTLQREALEMRKNGMTYRQIAEIQNCGAGTAASRVQKAIRREVPTELVDATRAVELDRMDTMTLMNLTLMQKAYDRGDVETFLKVQDRVNAIHDRRKTIVPIVQPTKVIIDQAVTTQSEQDRELSELIGKAADAVNRNLDSLKQQDLGPR